MRDPKMQYVAWTGVVTMHQAAWGDEAGSTVTFKLPMSTVCHGDHSDKRNPFHQYTKRRKGRAGTRFYMAVSTAEAAPKLLYKDEAMLAGWNDSQLHGHTVKFWLCNDGMGHPFEGVGRNTELALALSELDDDNEPIDQKMRDKVEKQVATGKQKLSNVAALMCLNPDFWEWLNKNELILGQIPVKTEMDATQVLRGYLGINSRAELDVNTVVATIFHRTVREPFSAETRNEG